VSPRAGLGGKGKFHPTEFRSTDLQTRKSVLITLVIKLNLTKTRLCGY